MKENIYIKCETKVRYKKLNSAMEALKSIRKSGRLTSQNFVAYECEFCNGFHLGHKK